VKFITAIFFQVITSRCRPRFLILSFYRVWVAVFKKFFEKKSWQIVLGFSGILKFGKRFVSKNQIEESLNLEYKGAGALGKSDGKKRKYQKTYLHWQIR